MPEEFLFGLGLILVIGIAAQWIAWRTRIPAILLLLIFGILAGPVTDIIHPDHLLGNTLLPIVSLSVAVILFETSLSLRIDELRKIGGIVIRLITIGILVTWILAALFSYWLLDFSLPISILFGSILVVTGPTVIIPLLRHVRPFDQVGSILRWEGIVNDPIGASLAVLVFEVILVSGSKIVVGGALLGAFKTLLFGGGVGLLGVYIIYLLLKRHLIPDFLQNPITLMVLIAVFLVSNMLQKESGLLAVTVMGFGLANQKSVQVRHIVEFKENLRVILLSLLFIILAARLKISDLEHVNSSILLYLALLLLVVRPVAVFLSTIRSRLTWRERLFLAVVAPRGVVAAAVSSIFALRLRLGGFHEFSLMVPYMFIIIIGTVTIYGLLAKPLARLLGVAKPEPRGILIMGAQQWVRYLALELRKRDIEVILADTNWQNVTEARFANLDTYYGNILGDYALDEMNLDGIGYFLAMTPNDEVNSLATLRFSSIVGRARSYQLAPETTTRRDEISGQLNGRILFDKQLTDRQIKALRSRGARFHTTRLTRDYDYNALLASDTQVIIPFFMFTSSGDVRVVATDNPPEPAANQWIITLNIDRQRAPDWLLTEESRPEDY